MSPAVEKIKRIIACVAGVGLWTAAPVATAAAATVTPTTGATSISTTGATSAPTTGATLTSTNGSTSTPTTGATSAIPGSDWRIVVSPYIWAASLKGDAALAGRSTSVDVPFSDIVKHVDFTFMGNIAVTNGRWGAFVDVQHVETSQEESVGRQILGLDVRTKSLAAGAYFRAYEYALGGSTIYGTPRKFAIEPVVGLRWTHLKARVSGLGMSTRRRADWTDPFVGVRFLADLNERWNVAAEADVGGFGMGSRLSANAQAYLGYNTTLFDRAVVWRAGYRVLYQDYRTHDFTGNTFRWDVTQRGPVLGFSMYF